MTYRVGINCISFVYPNRPHINSPNFRSFGDGLKEIIRSKMPTDTTMSPQEILQSCCKDKGITVASPATLYNWFHKEIRPDRTEQRRDAIFALAFALELTVEETTDLFHKVYLDRAFNKRSYKELIYYHCIKRGSAYSHAQKLISLVSFSEQVEDATVRTELISQQTESFADDLDLLAYILSNLPEELSVTHSSIIFKVIDKILLRASLNRNGVDFQVIEVCLNRPIDIDRISQIIQKSIKYRILFIFSFDERYLLLWRSFYLRESTDRVTSYHTTRCTSWIYSEYLCSDILSTCHLNDIDSSPNSTNYPLLRKTDDDNGEGIYFSDLLENVIMLNSAILDCDWVSIRFLVDWLNCHMVGSRISLDSILDKVTDTESFTLLDGQLFLEKNTITNYIAETNHSKYLVEINHTGRHPVEYFEHVQEPATFKQISNLLQNYTTTFEQKSPFAPQPDESSTPSNVSTSLFKETDIDGANRIEDVTSISFFNDQLKSLPKLKSCEDQELFIRAAEGDPDAQERLLLSNLRLVISISKKYWKSSIPRDDLIQEGVLGLMKAIKNYDIYKGYAFSTHATQWIKQAITRAIQDNEQLIRIPVHLAELFHSIKKLENSAMESGYNLSVDEIANELGVSREKIQDCLHFCDISISYYDPTESFEEVILPFCNLNEAIINIYESAEYIAERKFLKDKLISVISSLTPREEAVLKIRFGLIDGRPQTLEEAGKKCRVTRERIRQIEAKALRKLRHPSRSKHLRDFLD